MKITVALLLLLEFGWEYKWLILIGVVLLYVFFKIAREGIKKEIEEETHKQGGIIDIKEEDTIYLVNSTDSVSSIENAIESTVLIKTVDGHGSGFVIITDKGWMIITNNHVVDDITYVSLRMHNNIEEYGKVVRADEERDVALISFPNNSKSKAVRISSKKLSVGMDVYAIGSPIDENYANSVSKGVISAVNRKIEGLEYIQSDTTINPGNSGGPLLIDSYEVVGVAVSGLSANDGETTLGINHFIPIKSALNALKILN